MKAIISSTYDDNYIFSVPIVNWCWNKLGVGVICIMPDFASRSSFATYEQWLGRSTLVHNTANTCRFEYFRCPDNKQATYAQVSRLFAASLPHIPESEILISSDADMATFGGFHDFIFCKNKDLSQEVIDQLLNIIGRDLVSEDQYPICYAKAPAEVWARFMKINGKSIQKCLDAELGDIECDNFRGNMWCRDQELLRKNTNNERKIEFIRARTGTQFASKRVDRTDTNWKSYLGPDLVDAHLWRPGYTDENFDNILELLQTQYPTENFQWLIDYRQQYISLL